MSTRRRIAVTGMAVHTPLADSPDAFLAALLAGKSAITRWKSVDVSRCYAKIGADLGGFDLGARHQELAERLPAEVAARLGRLMFRLPWSPKHAVLLGAEAALDAGLSQAEMADSHVVVGGHNLGAIYQEEGYARFAAEPAALPVAHELYSLDSSQAAVLSELFGSRKPAYIVGGACASGNIALQAASREIVHHGARRVVVLGPVTEMSAATLHGFALLGALSIESFNDAPELASRPWDSRREGFVPAHGGGALILEDWEVAEARGARILAELCGVGVCSDASHLTIPNEDGQSRAMALALRRAGIAPEEVDYVSAHATSTPQGDLVELRAIRRALGARADAVKVNATKSMIGHSFCAAAVLEAIAGILQMNAGRLHGTINVDRPDPGVDVDVLAGGAADWPVRVFVNNAFGFGGIDTASVFKRVDA